MLFAHNWVSLVCSFKLGRWKSSLLFDKRVKTSKHVIKVNFIYSYEELQKIVYLINAKLKRILNGVKIEDDKLKEKNGDKDYFINFTLLIKDKKTSRI